MSYNLDDTIVALASAIGPALRAVVRLSGPRVAECLESALRNEDRQRLALPRVGPPRRVPVQLPLPRVDVAADLLYWPAARSYTRQSSAELHMTGSSPLASAAIEHFCRNGARAARPGEFTLRAFAAGRIDLTQAEGVLGVIDARREAELDAALGQLAGGVSAPLAALRDELLDLLAELEAGLDFAEEQIEFVDPHAMRRQFASALASVEQVAAQLRERAVDAALPRVVLTGPPNAGKSSLFNALVDRYGDASTPAAIVSPQSGTTRDFVVARVTFHGIASELVDTAGVEKAASRPPSIESAAQLAMHEQRRRADLRIECCARDSSEAPRPVDHSEAELVALTKCDLTNPADSASCLKGAILCSAVTGEGVDDLARETAKLLRAIAEETSQASFAVATAQRCRGSLDEAARALRAALALVGAGREELLAAELRTALHAIGEVLGAACADDVLDRVFSRFCIGK